MDSENDDVPKDEYLPQDMKPDIEKYEDLRDCLMEIASSFSNNDVHIPHILELLGKSYNIAQDLTIQEESPLYSDAMLQTVNQLEWQHRTLMEMANPVVSPGSCAGSQTPVPQKSVDENKLVRQKAIESTRQTPRVGGLHSLAGLAKAKELLHEAVFLPLRFPHLFVGGLQPSNKILLYGPPGTGKTHLVNAFAAEMNVPLYSVTSTDLVSTWLGESEKLIRELFDYTKEQGEYCFIFIDEVDSICRQRTSQDTEVTRRMKNELLMQLNMCNNQTFLLCATNCPWDIDSAFMRRFQRRIYIPLPSKNDRCDILKLQLRGANHSLSESDWSALLNLTDGFSGSDIANLVSSALLKPLRELAGSLHWAVNSRTELMKCSGATQNPSHHQVQTRSVNFTDFLAALQNTQRSVTKEDIARHKSWIQITEILVSGYLTQAHVPGTWAFTLRRNYMPPWNVHPTRPPLVVYRNWCTILLLPDSEVKELRHLVECQQDGLQTVKIHSS